MLGLANYRTRCHYRGVVALYSLIPLIHIRHNILPSRKASNPDDFLYPSPMAGTLNVDHNMGFEEQRNEKHT